MDKEPFCFNDKCHWHEAAVSPDCKAIDIDVPASDIIITDVFGDQKREIRRFVMIKKGAGLHAKFCESCQNAIQLVAPVGDAY